MRLLVPVLLLLGATVAGAAETLEVAAAASLSEAFREIGTLYTRKTGQPVRFNFGATNELRMQIEHGARADVFASASAEEMDKAVKAGVVNDPQTFATNRLVLIVPKGNPGKIGSLKDLARPGLKLVTTHPNVPVGKYTQTLLEKLAASPAYGSAYREAVKKNFRSLELNVKHVASKVSLGEADGGFVYDSDCTAKLGEAVIPLAIAPAYNVQATYPIGVVTRAGHGADAARFIDFVRSAAGQAVLASFNFGPAAK